MNEREQFQLEIESVKTLANRIRTELGLEVLVDDVDTYIGGENIFLLLLLQKFEIKQTQNHVEKTLEEAGYKCKDDNSKGTTSVWTKRSGQNLVFVFQSAIEFRKRASRATTLTELFKNRPDYILIAQEISEVHNSAVAREVFLSLSYDERFVNKTYGKDRRARRNSSLAAWLQEKYHVDTLVDDIGTYISGSLPRIHLYVREKETIGEINDFLQGEGYEYIEWPGTAEAGSWFWFKKSAEPVYAYTNEQYFKNELEEYEWLLFLFRERPDYALIAEMQMEVMRKTGEYREVFIGLANNPDFMKLFRL